jgi:hypothetical protein
VWEKWLNRKGFSPLLSSPLIHPSFLDSDTFSAGMNLEIVLRERFAELHHREDEIKFLKRSSKMNL